MLYKALIEVYEGLVSSDIYKFLENHCKIDNCRYKKSSMYNINNEYVIRIYKYFNDIKPTNVKRHTYDANASFNIAPKEKVSIEYILNIIKTIINNVPRGTI